MTYNVFGGTLNPAQLKLAVKSMITSRETIIDHAGYALVFEST